MLNRILNKYKSTPTSLNHEFDGHNVSLEELIQLRHSARAINLSNQRTVYTHNAGGYVSGFKGRGIDFEEVRSYLPGDDIRLMDWRVTARTGKAHTKIFREERERPVFILVDQGASMQFATRVAFKSVIAAQCAALVAWAAAEHNDRIGALIFAEQQHYESRPRGKKFGVLPILKNLAEASQQTVTPQKYSDPLANALGRLRRVVRPGSLIFIFSDFHFVSETSRNHLSQLSQHQDIICNSIYDPIESEPPPPNRYGISDGEQIANIDTSNTKFCQAYREYFTQRHQRLQTMLRQLSIPLISIATDDDIIQRLQFALAGQRRRA